MEYIDEWSLVGITSSFWTYPSTNPAIEQVEQNTLSQKEVGDQNLTEDQSSLDTGETSTESKDVTTQASESVVKTSCVADQPEEFPIQGPGKLPPARKTCTLEQAVKHTNSSSCDNLGPVHTSEFSNVYVFVKPKTHRSIRVHTTVFVAYSTVHTKTLESADPIVVWRKAAIYACSAFALATRPSNSKSSWSTKPISCSNWSRGGRPR